MLKSLGDLVETDKPVNPDLELTGLQKLMDGGCPVLFNNVKGKPDHRVLTNLFGDISVINRMFGWPDDTVRTRRARPRLVAAAAAAGDHRRRSAGARDRDRESRRR